MSLPSGYRQFGVPTDIDAIVNVNRLLVMLRIGRQEKAGVMLFKRSPHA